MLNLCITILVTASAVLAMVSGIWVAGGLVKEMLTRDQGNAPASEGQEA